MEVSGELYISSSSINSSSVVHVCSETCHKSIQTSYSSGTMLDGGSLASTVLSMLEDVPHRCPIKEDVIMDVLAGQVLKSLPLQYLTLWLLRHVLWRQGLSSSVLSGSGRDNLMIYNKSLPVVLERMGRLVCLRGCTKQCHFCSEINWFFG